MGALLSSPVSFPTSTSSLCVLPLRTSGHPRFSIAPGPMPRQLDSRLAEAEFQGVVAGINTTLQPLSGFSVLSLLFPFLVVDVLTMTLLSVIDPWLLISPWDYPLTDLLLPMGLEFGIIFCSFPLMAFAVNRRMGEVRRRVCELLDESSRRYGARGLSFQLKQGVLHNGASTNMWVEVQIIPVVHVHSPVPVPVPSLVPLLLPPDATIAPQPSSAPASTSAAAPPPTEGTGASALSSSHVEYLRVLQENQMLRQYLAQCQALVLQLLAREQHALMQQQQMAMQQQMQQTQPQTPQPNPTASATPPIDRARQDP